MPERKRLKRPDWTAAALELLPQVGHHQLTIHAMTDHLGVTKGPFYHHFPDVEAFHLAVEQWVSQCSENLLLIVEVLSNETREVGVLEGLSRCIEAKQEVAVRNWAAAEPLIFEHVQHVDQYRVTFLHNEVERRGITGEEGHALARVLYAAFIGLLTVFPHASAQARHEFELRLDLLSRAFLEQYAMPR